MRLLAGEHAPGELGAAGEAIREVERFGNHDAGFTVRPIRGRGALKSDTNAELEHRKMVGGGALVVSGAHGENLARENASFGNRPGEGARGFRFKNGKNDRVPFNEHFFRAISVEQLFNRFVKIETEVRSGVEAAREKVLGH